MAIGYDTYDTMQGIGSDPNIFNFGNYNDPSFGNNFSMPIENVSAPSYQQQVGGPVGMNTPNDFGPAYDNTSNEMMGPAQPSWFDRLGSSVSNLNFDPSSQKGMDNIFRAGQIGVGGLGAMLQMRENEKARKQQQAAIDYIKSQANPNAQLFQQRLMSMIDNPQGYLNDPVDTAMSQQAGEAAMRSANRQGRSGLTRDDMLGIQKVRQGSYQTRLKTLTDLYSEAQRGNIAAANAIGQISGQRVGGDTSAVMGALKGLFEGGRQIAGSSGIGSTMQQPRNYNYTPEQQAQYDSKFSELISR